METRLLRDCSATIIPQGTVITLEKDTPAFVTQTLGGNATIRIGQTLYRVSSVDVDALEGLDLGDSVSPAPIVLEGG
ncbi:MAG: putative Fe-S cluster assembly protein SufT, partial [Opitutales bacterium]|nr:putative Fe-S cluster assembly protein SufT [Opitutales bacterium]